MKIWELDLTDGRQYKDNGDTLWTVKNSGLVRISLRDCEIEISEDYTLRELLQLDFTEAIDWSDVAVDTPVMVSEYGPHNWCRRHFAYYDAKDKIVYAFNDGCTEWSSQGIVTGWEYFKLV